MLEACGCFKRVVRPVRSGPAGHFIHQTGVSRLARWGLLDRVVASNCRPVEAMTLDVGPFALTGTPPPVDGAAAATPCGEPCSTRSWSRRHPGGRDGGDRRRRRGPEFPRGAHGRGAYLRRAPHSHGDGWALVGDAGYHKDPLLALGISDAFRDAELLAEAIDAGLSGREPLGDALAGYEARRNAAAAQGYRNTIGLAALQRPPAEMQQLMAALVHDQDATNQFLGTVVGSVPAEEFFAPDNLARLMGGAAASVAPS